MIVEFIKRAAPIGLAYSVGQQAEFAEAYAMELIDRGYCKMINQAVQRTEEITEAVEVKPEEVVEEIESKPEDLVEAVVEQPEEVQKAVTKSNRKNK